MDPERLFIERESKQESAEMVSYLVVSVLVVVAAVCCFVNSSKIDEAIPGGISEELIQIGSAVLTTPSIPLLSQVFKHMRRRRQLHYVSDQFLVHCESEKASAKKCKEVRDFVKSLALPDKA